MKNETNHIAVGAVMVSVIALVITLSSLNSVQEDAPSVVPLNALFSMISAQADTSPAPPPTLLAEAQAVCNVSQTDPLADSATIQGCITTVCALPDATVKVVNVEAGTYFERVEVKNCSNISLIGAGVDQTIINGTNVQKPGGRDPSPALVGFGPLIKDGRTTDPLPENIEVADLSIVCDFPKDSTVCKHRVGLGMLIENVRIHDVRVEGWGGTAIAVFGSKNVQISDCTTAGEGRDRRSTGIVASRIFGFSPENIQIRDCTTRDSDVGIRLTRVTNAVVMDNTHIGGEVGLLINRSNDITYASNTITGIDPNFISPFNPDGTPNRNGNRDTAGVRISRSSNMIIEDNLICDTKLSPAIQFTARSISNTNNLVVDNQLLGYDPTCSADGICFDLPLSDSDGGGNVIEDNVSDPDGSCP